MYTNQTRYIKCRDSNSTPVGAMNLPAVVAQVTVYKETNVAYLNLDRFNTSCYISPTNSPSIRSRTAGKRAKTDGRNILVFELNMFNIKGEN